MQGLPLPYVFTPQVRLALKAIQENSPPPSQVLPITFPILRQLLHLLSSCYGHVVLRSAITLGYFGGLRGGEYLIPSNTLKPPAWHLRISDVTMYHKNGLYCMSVYIRRTKTQPHGLVVNIGCSGSEVCAVCSMSLMLKMREANVGSTLHALFIL
jgi:hypothetical protein